jgi:chromosome segregation ATPase
MKDSEILDQAISNMESLQGHLYTFRMKVGELGNLSDQRKNLLASIDALKSQHAGLENEIAGAQADLANIRQQHQETGKELYALDSEVTTKRTELAGLNNAISQIKAHLEAAA